MRYRGGGVGHLYMRAIEVWLAETGWGSDNTPVPVSEDIDPEDNGEDLDVIEGSKTDEGSRGSEDEMFEDDVASNTFSDSDRESDSDIDPNLEGMSSEEDEETMDGDYGFSGL